MSTARAWVCYTGMAHVVMACIITASRHEYNEGVGLFERAKYAEAAATFEKAGVAAYLWPIYLRPV